jgi:hypothetical protein
LPASIFPTPLLPFLVLGAPILEIFNRLDEPWRYYFIEDVQIVEWVCIHNHTSRRCTRLEIWLNIKRMSCDFLISCLVLHTLKDVDKPLMKESVSCPCDLTVAYHDEILHAEMAKVHKHLEQLQLFFRWASVSLQVVQ